VRTINKGVFIATSLRLQASGWRIGRDARSAFLRSA
jgi:hypothetical protein